MKATFWFNAVGVKTATPVLFCEDKGFLGARASYLVTESIVGKSLDDALMIEDDHVRVISSIDAFLKGSAGLVTAMEMQRHLISLWIKA